VYRKVRIPDRPGGLPSGSGAKVAFGLVDHTGGTPLVVSGGSMGLTSIMRHHTGTITPGRHGMPHGEMSILAGSRWGADDVKPREDRTPNRVV
jgi:hypothetical protein